MRLTDLIKIPSNINSGLKPARQATMLAVLGSPRDALTNDCQAPTNKALLALLGGGKVAGFKVFGLKPAVADLERIFAEIAQEQGEVFEALGSSGMLCSRLVRGSATAISNHAWGTAIDLNLEGQLDLPGNDLVQRGLALIAPIFNRHGWFWGAAFGREDAMHFEVGDDRMRQWHAEGLLSGRAPHLGGDVLSQGDRGPDVVALQKRLTHFGFELKLDGIFGPMTRATLVSFQTERALMPTGLLDADTAAALEEPEERGVILRVGSQGFAVRDWQSFLVQQGLLSGDGVDGRFGSQTRLSTEAFQRAQGLVPDGVVGPKTRAEAEGIGLERPTAPDAPAVALRRLRASELTLDIIRRAPGLLREIIAQAIGAQVPFTSGGKSYVGVLEWHFDERRGKHKGLSVFVPV